MRNYPTKEQMRQALVERETEEVVAKLEQSKVAVCGLGGLGSNIAIALARAGVGSLILIDYDVVDLSNMNRQQYEVEQIGRKKTDCMKETIKKIAPYCKVETHHVFLEKGNIKELLKDADVNCEAFDVAENKAILVNEVLEKLPNSYLVAASGMAGLGDANEIRTRKITEHFYLCGDGHSEVCDGQSLVAPRVLICASHQALCVLQILQRIERKEGLVNEQRG